MRSEEAAAAILATPAGTAPALSLILAAMGEAIHPHATAPGVLTIADPLREFGHPFVLVEVPTRKAPEMGGGALAAWEDESGPRVGLILCSWFKGGTIHALPAEGTGPDYRPLSDYRILGLVVGVHDPDGIDFTDADALTPEAAAEAIAATPTGFYIPLRLAYYALGDRVDHGRPRFSGTLLAIVRDGFGPGVGPGTVLEFDARDRLDIRPGFVVYAAVRDPLGVAHFGPYLIARESEDDGQGGTRERLTAFGGAGDFPLSALRVVGAVVRMVDENGGLSCPSGLDMVDPMRPARENAAARTRGEIPSPVVELPEMEAGK